MTSCYVCHNDANVCQRFNPKRKVCIGCENHFKDLVNDTTLCRWLNSTKKDCIRRAEKKGVPADITMQDLVDILPYDFKCPILGIKLKVGNYTDNEGWRSSPTLDRIDPSKGYIRGNIQFISGLANAMKSQAGEEELLLFAKWVEKTYR